MNILTFDIEDWWVYEHYGMGNKNEFLPRLDKYLNNILDLLDKKNTKATFFCLGIIARNYPKVIKLIDNRGHQIACHSDIHSFLSDRDESFFYNDTKKAIDSLEQVIGKKIIAYRAPAFSFTEKNKWAFTILHSLGITEDSSIYPAKRAFGGFSSFAGSKEKPVLIQYNDTIIKEFPITLSSILGKYIAYSGGGYFRLLPYSFIKNKMEKSEYVMTYFHIKDFDFEQKKVFYTRYIQNYYGLKKAYHKFQSLIDDFKFVSINQATEMTNWDKISIIQL